MSADDINRNRGNQLTLAAARDIVWNILTENSDSTCTMHGVLSPLRVRALHFLIVVSESHELSELVTRVVVERLGLLTGFGGPHKPS